MFEHLDWGLLASAIALVFIFEGMLPFLVPRVWREAMRNATQMPDQQLRIAGLISMASGVALLLWISP